MVGERDGGRDLRRVFYVANASDFKIDLQIDSPSHLSAVYFLPPAIDPPIFL
jgi:hypothetical protein